MLNDTQILFDGLAVPFANYDTLIGSVERVSRSTCGRLPSPLDDMANDALSPGVTAADNPIQVLIAIF